MIGMLRGHADGRRRIGHYRGRGVGWARSDAIRRLGFHARRPGNRLSTLPVECVPGRHHFIRLRHAGLETHVPAIAEGQWHRTESRAIVAVHFASRSTGEAVADGDATALAKAPGLGKKGAQKIILELKGSIDLSQIEGSSATASTPEDTGAEQVVEGLMSLGWHQQDAVHAVQTVCADNQIETPLNAEDVPRVLKLALTSLDRGR